MKPKPFQLGLRLAPTTNGKSFLKRVFTMNREEAGRRGGLKARKTAARMAKQPAKSTLFEACRTCGKRKILMVNGTCLTCLTARKGR
jgi:hypothetical protein